MENEEEKNIPIIEYTDSDVDLLARLMRAEALGEGELGMLMVGNVVVNRVISTCLSFKSVDTVEKVVYQTPGGFAGINSPLFKAPSTSEERDLAINVLDGATYFPATHALWFYSPKQGEECLDTWFNQRNAGRYKNHCFYKPDPGACPDLY